MIEALLVMMIFLAGAFFAICIMSNMIPAAVIIGIMGFILIIGLIGMMRRATNELVIKKLCYIYSFIAILPANNPISKTIRRTLKELALDTCGPGNYSLWLKWESYFNQKVNEWRKEQDGIQ